MMHCTNCTYFWTPCDSGFSRGLAEACIVFCPNSAARSGQVRPGLISSHLLSLPDLDLFPPFVSHATFFSHIHSPASHKSPLNPLLSVLNISFFTLVSDPPALRHPITVPLTRILWIH
ncbi:uncharacterized protein TrAFT101_002689 [Trichoderma asperellum]|uniref:uncharacterized protein n=1 Tax=Trichoderma asperellum TaxID=101201 RepID=UPI00331C7908|nr:hypothetical protein TrAFT101_002689 [Trichoderma asperellum]